VRAIDRADRREHSAVVVLADQVEAALVEECAEARVGVPGVLLARQLWRSVGAGSRRSRWDGGNRWRAVAGWLRVL